MKMVRVWVVGHPYLRRRWCEVRIREAHDNVWQRGFVWAEWNAPEADGAIVPRLPSPSSAPMSNVDPLVFGPRMYFDYCRKGRSSTGRNNGPANGLEPDDLVLFAGAHRNAIWIDTVFSIGSTRQWPTTRGIPAWDNVGEIAARVHFHEHAQRQHPEVRDTRTPARSYRSASDRDGGKRFAWVPWSRSVRQPLELSPGSRAFAALQQIYPNKNLYDGFTGSFAVAHAREALVQELFEQLLETAQDQGFCCASEIDFVDRDEITFDASGPGCRSSAAEAGQ
ncbi:MAG TPA: hypothetical protein VMJ10_30180 [Kofleriaceae bacterium]|nr:hypothetical protein [Kofleriaceae bacterium]